MITFIFNIIVPITIIDPYWFLIVFFFSFLTFLIMLYSIVLPLILLPSIFPFNNFEFLSLGKKTRDFGRLIGLNSLHVCIDRDFLDLSCLVNRYSNFF